jgi:hypothetical protein
MCGHLNAGHSDGASEVGRNRDPSYTQDDIQPNTLLVRAASVTEIVRVEQQLVHEVGPQFDPLAVATTGGDT